MNSRELTAHIKQQAARLGFDRCGVAPVAAIGRADYVRSWLAAGRSGTMTYLSRHADARMNPSSLLDGAAAIIVVALLYHQHPPEPVAPDRTGDVLDRAAKEFAAAPRGRIARYAWGEDYHVVLKDKLFELVDQIRAALGRDFGFKVCVDTAPLIEREAAAAAGIGWIGKNTMVLDRRLGSYFFLGAVITTLDLIPDDSVSDHCGACTACLDACPTAAFPAAYQMDASRCISYLTIEHRGEIHESLARRSGDWVFGCDICQEVCPFNRHAPETREPRFAARPPAPSLLLDDIQNWSPDDYRTALRGSAIKRAKLDMLQRNARIAKHNAEVSP